MIEVGLTVPKFRWRLNASRCVVVFIMECVLDQILKNVISEPK